MTTRGKATGKSERMAVLDNAEQEALYGLPDFDDTQRLEYLLWMNLSWRWPVVVRGFMLKFIASSRSLILKPNTYFSALGGVMLKMTAILS